MEKFMFIFRGSDVYQPDQKPEALQALKETLLNWVAGLSEKGIHVSSEPLLPNGRQVSGRNKTVTDSPFGLSREIIGGCTIVQARDMAEAVEIARACPILESNANIEIRPIQNLA